MSRTRASAKKAGTAFETAIAGHLADTIGDSIERRARNGSKDRGDISGVRTMSHPLYRQRVVLECKNTAQAKLGPWMREAHLEAGNDDALLGVVVHKRHGNGNPGEQWVTMTVDDFVALLTGVHPGWAL